MNAGEPRWPVSWEIFKTGLWSPHKPQYVEKISPCRQVCPIGIDMARAFVLASKGELDQALRLVRQDNPLPGICGRVCYHPCEGQCNRSHFDEAVNIRGFERYLADHGQVDLQEEAPKLSRKKRIAVIGSGPAGLSAAYQLARMGYKVSIYEAWPEPGGMLRYGIPEYRLPKKVLRKEIGFIRQLGVEINKALPELYPAKEGFYQRMDCSKCGGYWMNYLKLSGKEVPPEKEEGERKDNSERGNRA